MRKFTSFSIVLAVLMLGFVQMVSAENLPLKIGGVQVTTDNKNSFDGLRVSAGTNLVQVVVESDYGYSNTDSDVPWLDFTGDKTYTRFGVLFRKSDVSIKVFCKGQCIRSAGPLTIATYKTEDVTVKYDFLLLNSKEAPAIECTDLHLSLITSEFRISSEAKYGIKLNGVFEYDCTQRYSSGVVSDYWSWIQGKEAAVTGMTEFTNKRSGEYVHDQTAYKPSVRGGEFYDHDGDICRKVNFTTDSQEHLEEFCHITGLYVQGKRVTLYNCNDVLGDRKVKSSWDVEKSKLTGNYSIKKIYLSFMNYGLEATMEPVIKCNDNVPLIISYAGECVFFNRKNSDANFVVAKNNVDFNWFGHEDDAHLTFNYTGTKKAMISTPGVVTFRQGGKYDIVSDYMPLFDACSKVKLAGRTHIFVSGSGMDIGTSSCGTVGLCDDATLFGYKVWGFRPSVHTYGQATWNNSTKQFREAGGEAYMELFIMHEFRDYGIVVADTRVNTWNMHDVFGDGQVSYDADWRRLTLFNFNHTPYNIGAVIDIEPTNGIYNIEAKGTTTLTGDGYKTGIRTGGADVNLSGKLSISNVKTGIDVGGATLTLNSCNLTVDASQYGIYGNGTGALTVNSSAINVKGGTYSVSGLRAMTLNNCIISSPSGASYNASKKGVVVSSTLTNKAVVTSPNSVAYNLYINSTSTGQVTDVNCGDILGDGSVYFVPAKRRLVVAEGTHLTSIQVQGKNSSRVTLDTIIIETMGDAQIDKILFNTNQYLEVNSTGGTISMTNNLSAPGIIKFKDGTKVTSSAGSLTSNSKTNTLIMEANTSLFAAKGVDATAVQLNSGLGVVGGTFNSTQKGYVDASGNHASNILITPKQFNVWFDGVQLTTDNYEAPLGNGVPVTTDPRTKTITVTNLTYSTQGNFFLETEEPGYTLKFEGKNYISSSAGVIKSDSLIICKNSQSNNTLHIVSTSDVFDAVSAKGLSFISGTKYEDLFDRDSVLIEGTYGGLNINGNVLNVETRYTVIGMKSEGNTGLFNASEIKSIFPVGNAEYDGMKLMKKGRAYTGWAWFNHAEKDFPFVVNGDTVNMYNFDDILGDGTLYIPNENGAYVDENTLIFNNCNAENLNIKTLNVSPLIMVEGNNIITSSAAVFDFTNGANLYTNNGYGALRINYTGKDFAVNNFGNSSLSVNTTMNIAAPIGGGMWADGSALYLDKYASDVPADRDSLIVIGAENGSIVGFGAFETEQHYLASPAYVEFVPNVGFAVNGVATKLCVSILPGEASAVETVDNAQSTMRKYIRDGQLYIVRDGRTYNALGVEVR